MKSKIIFSSKEIDVYDKFLFTQFNNMVQIDKCTNDESIILDVDNIVYVETTKDDEEQYTSVVVLTTDGTMYYTGSESVFNQLEQILEDFEAFELPKLKFYKSDSKKREGKKYISVIPVR